MMPSIPTTLLCGFLGSGKTTRINRLIRSGELDNALFLVNDFGRINIDAELIESREDDILRLTNGCACCGIAGNLSAQLRAIRHWPRRPAHLVFEASGVARPRPLMELLDAARGYRLEHSESLVDASAFEHHARDTTINDIVIAQIRDIACLRVNRIDWLSPARRDEVLARIRAINAAACMILEKAGHPPPDSLTTTSARREDGPLVTQSMALTRRIDIAALDALLAAAAPCLVRVKGLIQADDETGTRYAVQFAGGHTTRTATRAGRTQALVLIGHQGDMLQRLLASLHGL